MNKDAERLLYHMKVLRKELIEKANPFCRIDPHFGAIGYPCLFEQIEYAVQEVISKTVRPPVRMRGGVNGLSVQIYYPPSSLHFGRFDAMFAIASNSAILRVDFDKIKTRAIDRISDWEDWLASSDFDYVIESRFRQEYPVAGQEDRDRFIYERIGTMKCDDLIDELETYCEKMRTWKKITSRPGLKDAADRYAQYHNLEERRFG